MNAIDIDLLVTPDCPHEAAAENVLRTALPTSACPPTSRW